MKNQVLLLCFLMASIAGFSQISKADAAAFLTRNPVENTSGLVIWDGADKTEFTKDAITSLKAMDSGFLLIVKQNGVDREKFYPYSSVKLITINSVNNMNITLRN